MREVILVQVVLQDPKVREVSRGPGGAKDKLAHVETLVSGPVATRYANVSSYYGLLTWNLTRHMRRGRQLT